MCICYFTVGHCFDDCFNISSHVKKQSDIPTDKKSAFTAFHKLCHPWLSCKGPSKESRTRVSFSSPGPSPRAKLASTPPTYSYLHIQKLQKQPLPLIQAVRFILSAKLSNSSPVPFIFKAKEAAAKHNWEILERHNGNLGKAIDAYPKSPLSYGSEFCPTGIIEDLFCRYPLWDQLIKILECGVNSTLYCYAVPTKRWGKIITKRRVCTWNS
jgi:hypothetical protein